MSDRVCTRAWLERQQRPPEPLRSELLALFAGEDGACAVAEPDAAMVELLVATAAERLRAATAVMSRTQPESGAAGASAADAAGVLRPGAADLLLADALTTYAVAAAAEAGIAMTDVLRSLEGATIGPHGDAA